MPSVSVPVFDHARVDARLQAARAGEREALLAYRQRVLLATEEVESALAQARQGQLRLASLQEQARQAVLAEQPARKRFEAGGTDLLELLDAQRSAQRAEIGLSLALTGQQQQRWWGCSARWDRASCRTVAQQWWVLPSGRGDA